MLRKIPFIFVLLLVMFSFSSCSPPTTTAPSENSFATQRRSDSAGTDIADETEGSSTEIVPLVDIPQTSTVVSIVNKNFDLERNEEQVIILKDSADASSPLRLVVAAYDSVLENYREVFAEQVLAVNAKAFSLTFTDIVGDHNLELVCRGLDADNRQTLDIFHRTTSPTGFGLYYENIFAISVDGSIEIQELKRSGAYQVGQANGVSFPIVVQTQDEDSDNPLDLIQITYYWRFTEKSFIEGKKESIAGREIEQQQLRELYRRNADAFEQYLSGSWYLVDDGSGEAGDTIILNFDSKGRFFTYYTGELQEVYRWMSTHKLLMSRVQINGDNELVPFIRKKFSVQVESMETMRIRGTDPWQGLYAKLSPRIAGDMASGKQEKYQFPELAGAYFSDAGTELLFDGNSYRMIEGGTVEAGGFALYQAGVPVLELRALNAAGLTTRSRRYRFEYNEETRDQRIFRTLFLVPGIVGIYGFEAVEETYIRYEQIEDVDDSTE